LPRKLSADEAVAKLRSFADLTAIAEFLDTSAKRLNFHLYGKGRKPYYEFELAKRAGGTRKIRAPQPPLSIWQRKIADLLRDAYRPRNASHAFCLDRSVATNARAHVGKRFVLNVDLLDFFGSIHFGRVRGLFRSAPFGLPDGSSAILAHLLCVDGELPQGAPSSPAATNWICRSLDRELSKLAKTLRCTYTRYADDITFSGSHRSVPEALMKSREGRIVLLGEPLRSIISQAGFTINEAKVSLRTNGERQVVSGVTVNKRPNVRRQFLREVRAALYNWKADGYAAANEFFKQAAFGNAAGGELKHWIGGRLAYGSMIRGNCDPLVLALRARFNVLKYEEFGSVTAPLCVAPLRNDAMHRRAAMAATWLVLVTDGSGQTVSQGTGFSIRTGKVVTCHHVIEDAVQKDHSIQLVSADGGYKTKASVLASEGLPVDLALLEPSTPIFAYFEVQQALPDASASLLLAGFANWGANNDKLRFDSADLVDTQMKSTIYRIGCSVTIVGGMSGGPMLQRGKVVGVISDKHDSPRLKNAAVSAAHLTLLPSTEELF
jgi:RNA-directed DNA polymerase